MVPAEAPVEASEMVEALEVVETAEPDLLPQPTFSPRFHNCRKNVFPAKAHFRMTCNILTSRFSRSHEIMRRLCRGP